MTTRKQKIEELLESFSSLRRTMSFHGAHSQKLPLITPSQWGVLMLMEHRSDLSIKDLAGILHISSSATTQLVDGLVKNKYVVRKEDPRDRRSVSLTVSKKTKNHIEKMKDRMTQKFLELFEALTDKELDQYSALHKKIIQRLLNKK